MSNGHNLTLFNLFILLILLRWNIYQYAESTCRVKWEMLFFGGLKLFVNLLIFFFWERFIVTKAFQPGCWSMPNHFGLQGQYSRETTVITQVLFRGLENVVIKSQDRIYLRIYLRNISDTCDWGHWLRTWESRFVKVYTKDDKTRTVLLSTTSLINPDLPK